MKLCAYYTILASHKIANECFQRKKYVLSGRKTKSNICIFTTKGKNESGNKLKQFASSAG